MQMVSTFVKSVGNAKSAILRCGDELFKEHAEKLPEVSVPKEAYTVEMDELFTSWIS